MRDVIDIEIAPASAQVICMETWRLLATLMVDKKEDLESIKEWFAVLFGHAMSQFRGTGRKEGLDGQNKSKVRVLENIVVKAMQALTVIIPLAVEDLASLVESIPCSFSSISDHRCHRPARQIVS